MVWPPTERWGVTAELRPLVGGHRNLAFRTLGLQRDLVFKSTRRAPAAIAWLLHIQQIARQSGFVVPDLLESRNGRLSEQGWTCETYVAGTPFAPEKMPDILPRISAFHAATARLPQRPGFLSSRALLHKVAGGDVDLNAMPAGLVSLCRKAWLAVSDRCEAVIHGDLNPANLILCPDGGVALLDWDECRRDLVLFDLGPLREGDQKEHKARLAWEVACSWVLEPDHAKKVSMHL